MSWLEQWEAIKDHRLAADTSANRARDNAKQIIDLFNEGVPISVANRIIKEHWGDSHQGRRLRTQLFSAFPDENGRVLRSACLTQEDLDRFRGEYTDVIAYFEAIHAYVLEHVEQLTLYLNKADPNDEELFGAYNSFRRNAMRYTSYVDDNFFTVRGILEEGQVQTWQALTKLVPIDSIDSGDYLFMDEFVTKLKSVQQHYIGRELEVEAQDMYSVADIEWLLKKALVHIQIPYLFAEYLNELLGRSQ